MRIPGKKVRSEISGWSADKYGVSLSSRAIAQVLTLGEIAPEVQNVLSSISAGRPFGEQ
jgi:hypothetical protein